MSKKSYIRKLSSITPLNQKRVDMGISLQDVGNAVGLSSQATSVWFSGKAIPKERYIPALAKLLEVSPEWIREACSNTKSAKVPPTVKSTKPANRVVTDDFWGKIRKESNLTIKEITELLEINRSHKTVNQYFTGHLMPSDNIITRICNLFDVDFAVGKAEFIKLNKAYWGDKCQTTKKANLAIPEPTATTTEDKTPTTGTSLSANPITDKCVGRLIYGNVSYDEYNLIKNIVGDNASVSDLPRLIYDKVDYDTFNKVLEILGV